MDAKERQARYHKQWREAHKDEIKQYQKQYQTRNQQQRKEYTKKWREAHKDEIKQYRRTHKEQKKNHDRKYRETHKEHIKQYKRKYYNVGTTHMRDEDLPDDFPSEIQELKEKWLTPETPETKYKDLIDKYTGATLEDTDDVLTFINEVIQIRNRGIFSRGIEWERDIGYFLYALLLGTKYYVYYQVPWQTMRRADFVITDEDKEKDQLDLSRAVIVSTKTNSGHTWQQDQPLYSMCSKYYMLQIDKYAPTDELPENVKFVSLAAESSTDKLLTFEDFIKELTN